MYVAGTSIACFDETNTTLGRSVFCYLQAGNRTVVGDYVAAISDIGVAVLRVVSPSGGLVKVLTRRHGH